MAKYNAAQTACKRGHPFTEENTRLYQGRRICRTCVRDQSRIWVLTHPDRHRENVRRWRSQNPERWAQINIENQRRARARNPDRHRRRLRDYHWTLKKEALARYGNGEPRCVSCGFYNIDALCLDHINNDGAAQRRLSPKTHIGVELYRTLRRAGYPQGFQTLCANCNQIKEVRRRRLRATANA